MEKRKIFYVVIGLVVAFIVIQTVIDISREKRENDSGGSTTGSDVVKETTSGNSNDTDDEGVLAKIEELKQIYPDGMFWNHMGIDEDKYEEGKSYTTEIPCNHNKNNTKYCNVYKGKSNDAYPYAVAGRQSVGFASAISDYIFGKESEAYSFTEYEKVRVGDQARVDNDTRTVLVIGKYDDYIEVVGVNDDGVSCQIKWGEIIKKNQLQDAFYISRY